MADLDGLHQLARLHGIQLLWHDIWGVEREVGEATLRALLTAMHVPADSDAQVHAALRARHVELWCERVPPVVVVRAGEQRLRMLLRLPSALDARPLDLRLQPESGPPRSWRFQPDTLAELERTTVNSVPHVARQLELLEPLEPGYYRYALLDDEERLGEGTLVAAPGTVYVPAALHGDARVWGPAIQLYALRSRRDWGVGDFTDLRQALEQWAARGAALVGVNPLHALFPHDPTRASPYSPSSRLFVNVIYLDPEQIEDFHECEGAQSLLASAPFRARLDALRAAELIDYAGVAQAKREVLELLYTSFRSRHLAQASARAGAFRAFQQRCGEALERHALFEALQEHFHRRDPGLWGWPVWPQAYRDPSSAQVREFAQTNRARVEFYQWLQWQADVQLERVGLRSLELSLGVGLYGDLAVSVDRGGAEAWAEQDLYALGASIGAPPDDFNLNGQDWGLPPWIPQRLRAAAYEPFIATLRANMRHTGALRVDHVMGLLRLFWIPQQTRERQGAYVHYPLDDLLGILALESHRHRCMVIGEDLGTVPDAVRDALGHAGVLSYRLLYFEREQDGEFKAPPDYPAQALVAASTHDLPTLAGFWEGRDLELRARLKLFPSEEVYRQQVLARVQDRARLLAALHRSGLLPDGASLDPAAARQFTAQLGRALHLYLARTPSKVLLVQLEDALGALEQVNLPGTTEQYPNWRRRLPTPLERWPLLPEFTELCAALERERARGASRPPCSGAPRRAASRASSRPS
jgi:(1->4)-alpha-D-glucan 1-alpha-D-glucosylmutase